MKKWMNYVLIAGLSAGTASAAWWPFGSGEKENKESEAPVAPTPEKPRMKHREGGEGRLRDSVSPEQREKMRAKHEQLKKLGEAARNETDPVKKEELVGQLRAQLTEIADKMQAEGRKRLEQADKEIPKLREKLAEAEKNKAERIEKQIQQILAGEPLRPLGEKHQGKPGEEPRKKGPKPPAAE